MACAKSNAAECLAMCFFKNVFDKNEPMEQETNNTFVLDKFWPHLSIGVKMKMKKLFHNLEVHFFKMLKRLSTPFTELFLGILVVEVFRRLPHMSSSKLESSHPKSSFLHQTFSTWRFHHQLVTDNVPGICINNLSGTLKRYDSQNRTIWVLCYNAEYFPH